MATAYAQLEQALGETAVALLANATIAVPGIAAPIECVFTRNDGITGDFAHAQRTHVILRTEALTVPLPEETAVTVTEGTSAATVHAFRVASRVDLDHVGQTLVDLRIAA